MSAGIVVEHKESGVRYAISKRNFNEKEHKEIRDLKPGETVRGFKPLAKEPLGGKAAVEPTPKPEGSSPEGTKATK